MEALPEVKTRHVDMRNLDSDVRIIMDIFNDAWIDNWGFVPYTENELSKMAADLKLIAIPELTYIAEIDGEPAAVALALPNLNELIRDSTASLVRSSSPSCSGGSRSRVRRRPAWPSSASARSSAANANTPASASTSTPR